MSLKVRPEPTGLLYHPSNGLKKQERLKDAGKGFDILRNEAIKQLESLNKITKDRSMSGRLNKD